MGTRELGVGLRRAWVQNGETNSEDREMRPPPCARHTLDTQ
jgi:hypothetical protein